MPLVAVVLRFSPLFPCFPTSAFSCVTFILPTFCLLLAMYPAIYRTVCRQFQQNDRRRACGLIVTALLLMYSIDSALNTIWRSKRARPKIYSFAVYWMINAGAAVAGASLAISSICSLSLRWASDLNTVIDNVLRIFRCCCRGSLSGCCTASFLPSVYLTATRLSARLSPRSVRSRKERFRALYHHVPIISAHLRCAGGDPHSLCLGLLDMVYRRLGAEITVTLGEYRKIKNKLLNKKTTNHDCINSTRNPCQRHRGGRSDGRNWRGTFGVIRCRKG